METPLYEETVSAMGGNDPLRKDLEHYAVCVKYATAKDALAAVATSEPELEGGEKDGKATRRVPRRPASGAAE